MKAWQRQIRERKQSEAEFENLFGAWWSDLDTSLATAVVREVDSDIAAKIILEYEWLGSMPQATKRCFGMYCGNAIAGALVFAEKPGSNLASDRNSVVPSTALYLARGACVHWAHPHSASWFISTVAKQFLGDCCILAYSDPAAGEIGTIYQALNWNYIGPAKGGPHAALVDGKLITLRSFNRDRKYNVGQSLAEVRAAFPSSIVTPVGRKHRYLGVYGSPKYRRDWNAKFQRYVLPYPKRAVEVSGEIRSETIAEGAGQFCDTAP